MKTAAPALFAIAGALAGFLLGYATMARPAADALASERAAHKAEMTAYENAVNKRNNEISKLLNRMTGTAESAGSIDPKALAEVLKLLTAAIEQPITYESPEPGRSGQ
ncbi:MAG: hypothetical protein KIT75_03540 [Planctomycetota bacterium]|nr:hypothetical protein [Planctomycetota bacterium]